MASVVGADITIAGDHGIVAAVEVKNRRHLTPEVAAAFRKNLIEDGSLQDEPYFLLVSQDAAHLWGPGDAKDANALPDTSMSMDAVIEKYGVARSNNRLRGGELELVVRTWLNDLIWLDPAGVTDGPELELRRLGFLDAVHGGTLAWVIG